MQEIGLFLEVLGISILGSTGYLTPKMIVDDSYAKYAGGSNVNFYEKARVGRNLKRLRLNQWGLAGVLILVLGFATQFVGVFHS